MSERIGGGVSNTSMIQYNVVETEERDNETRSYWIRRLLSTWTTRSPTVLQNVESNILSHVRTPFRRFYVDIGYNRKGEALHIWTVSMNEHLTGPPLVLLHGLGGGVALWLLNYDALAEKRPLYAIDIIGFGRSSRPEFPESPEDCEKEFVRCINEWRKSMNIRQMFLLGHSFGGFLATSYTLKYPRRIVHLILADPWGYLEKPMQQATINTLPRWARVTIRSMPTWNPLWPLRAAGPFGKWIVQKIRHDILEKFEEIAPDLSDQFLTYIHQCNVRKPTGESAFQVMMSHFFWAKEPMIRRIDKMAHFVPMTFILGGKSWLDPSTGVKVQEKRKNSFVEVNIIPGSGHHVYALHAESFNSHVNDVLHRYDSLVAKINSAD